MRGCPGRGGGGGVKDYSDELCCHGNGYRIGWTRVILRPGIHGAEYGLVGGIGCFFLCVCVWQVPYPYLRLSAVTK